MSESPEADDLSIGDGELVKWRREGNAYRNSESQATSKTAPPGVSGYWIRHALILLEKKFEMYDLDQNGSIDIEEIIKSTALAEEERISLAEAFKQVDLNAKGELDFSEFFALVFSQAVQKGMRGLDLFFPSAGVQQDPFISDQEAVMEGFMHLADLINKSSKEQGKLHVESAVAESILRDLFAKTPGIDQLILIVMERHFPDEKKPMTRARFLLMLLYDMLSMIEGSGVKGLYITGFEGYVAPLKDWSKEGNDFTIGEALKVFEHRFTEFALDGTKFMSLEALLLPGRLWIGAEARKELEVLIKSQSVNDKKTLGFMEFFALLHTWSLSERSRIKYFFPSPSNRSVVRACFELMTSWLDSYASAKTATSQAALSRNDLDRLFRQKFTSRYEHYKRVVKRNFQTEGHTLDLERLWMFLYDLMCSVDGYPLKGTYLVCFERYIAPQNLGASQVEWIGEALKVFERRFAEMDLDGNRMISAEELARGLPIGYDERKKLLEAFSSKGMNFGEFVATLYSTTEFADSHFLKHIFPSESNQAVVSKFFQEYRTISIGSALDDHADPSEALDKLFKDLPASHRNSFAKVKERYELNKDFSLEVFVTLLYNVFCMEKQSALSGTYLLVEIFPFSEALRRLEQYYSKHCKAQKIWLSDFQNHVAQEDKELGKRFEVIFPKIEDGAAREFDFGKFLGGICKYMLESRSNASVLEFMFDDELEAEGNSSESGQACAQSFVDLSKVLIAKVLGSTSPGDSASSQVWANLNKRDESDVERVVNQVLEEMFPRYLGRYEDIAPESMTLLRHAIRAKKLDARSFMLHLYNVHCEIQGLDDSLDPTLRLKGNHKFLVPSLDFSMSLDKKRNEYSQELKEETDKRISTLQRRVDELEAICKGLKPVEVRKSADNTEPLRQIAEASERSMSNLEARKRERERIRADRLRERDRKVEDERQMRQEYLNQIAWLKRRIQELVIEQAERNEEQEAAKSGVKSLKMKKMAFLSRETTVVPDEQLDANDRDMISGLMRNPGMGAFSIAFIIAYFGISFGKSSVEALELSSGLGAAQNAEAQGTVADEAEKCCGGAGMDRCSAIVQKGLDVAHVFFSVWVSSLLAIVMLVVQFAYVFLIANEAEDNYNSGFCPGYDLQHSHLIGPDYGATAIIRGLMVFIGIYFVSKTFSQAVLYSRSLTERTIDKREVSVVRGMFSEAINFVTCKKAEQSSEDSKQGEREITWKGLKCSTRDCSRNAWFGIKPDDNGDGKPAEVGLPAKGSAASVDRWCAKCAQDQHRRQDMICKFDFVRECDMVECKQPARYAIHINDDDTWSEEPKHPNDYRFCRSHAVHGCTILQHEAQPPVKKYFMFCCPTANQCHPPELYQPCDLRECYNCVAYTTEQGTKPGKTERRCKLHAEELAETKSKEPSSLRQRAEQAALSFWASRASRGEPEHVRIVHQYCSHFERHNMWRDVQDSAIYPIFCFDVCVNLALVYCVLLCNLYIVFVDGASVQDILSKVVILDFIFMLQTNLKREMLQGPSGKKLLDAIKTAYNMPGDIALNQLCSKSFANILYLLNFFPFLVSASMTVYGPLCKPGVAATGFLPSAIAHKK